MFVFAVEEPMVDFGYSMLDLEDESYYSSMEVNIESLSVSGDHSVIEFEGESMPNGDDEPVLDLEDTPPPTLLDESALAPTADPGTVSPNSETAEKSQESNQEKAKKEEKEKQEPREGTIEIKLLRAESRKEKLMHVIHDLEKVIADKEHECKKAEAELEETASKFRVTQHRALLREAYVEQMHARNNEMIHEKKLSDVEKKKLERKMQYEIDRQKEQNLHIQNKLEKAIEGVREMFDEHKKDHENRVEAAKVYQENVEDHNERLFWFLHFMDATEEYVWSHRIPDKDVFYEAEVNLLRSRTIDWTGSPPTIDYPPNSNQLAIQYPRDRDEISDDCATGDDGIAIDTPRSSVSGAYEVMGAFWGSDEISDDYASSCDR
ncbi:hypothetical protein N7448_000262 [Penicillium atrosanguineum]|uniref:Uncharacterized protein n=1 Tax=Penicillium atrosanguineum TaxID=1132637 RepID=A0A9W9HJH8_9EURO|nr:uncharacterized protein N7443_003660 [Penicillium atrosanguineum]KAJ5134719.1 hypothetical protein N7526_006084 [Penicillium atrosanguineum]KAJ5148684.1 hypothetical protein N7448_000262 [Penicillium atrosanguineum]KAJ5304000.1 hypothetical protein N7443_003660 [Penicillium atrosanguineum]KAJ5323478.1 hypothetical protein N7476_002078 [Penicillium atrosanguineum]